jgi:hypothetical protein
MEVKETTKMKALSPAGPKRIDAQNNSGSGAKIKAEAVFAAALCVSNTRTLTNTIPNANTHASAHRARVAFRIQEKPLSPNSKIVGTSVSVAIMGDLRVMPWREREDITQVTRKTRHGRPISLLRSSLWRNTT